jgi:hypothetical protein
MCSFIDRERSAHALEIRLIYGPLEEIFFNGMWMVAVDTHTVEHWWWCPLTGMQGFGLQSSAETSLSLAYYSEHSADTRHLSSLSSYLLKDPIRHFHLQYAHNYLMAKC